MQRRHFISNNSQKQRPALERLILFFLLLCSPMDYEFFLDKGALVHSGTTLDLNGFLVPYTSNILVDDWSSKCYSMRPSCKSSLLVSLSTKLVYQMFIITNL